MKIWGVLVSIFWLNVGTSGFRWSEELRADSGTFQVCSGQSIQLFWNYTLEKGERVKDDDFDDNDDDDDDDVVDDDDDDDDDDDAAAAAANDDDDDDDDNVDDNDDDVDAAAAAADDDDDDDGDDDDDNVHDNDDPDDNKDDDDDDDDDDGEDGDDKGDDDYDDDDDDDDDDDNGMVWGCQPEGGAEDVLATFVDDHFVPTSSFSGRLAHLHDGGIELSCATILESGNYSIAVSTEDSDNSLTVHRKTVSVKVVDTPKSQSGQFNVSKTAEAVRDVISGEWHVQLVCGNFSDRGHPPVKVMWTVRTCVVTPRSQSMAAFMAG
ncbi:hypothetical protein ACOMHN_012078 [Nucella lapillus]